MRFVLLYIRSKAAAAILAAVFCAVFAASFALYGLPTDAVLYPAAICAVIGVIAMAVDFIEKYKKHRYLVGVSKVSAELIEKLPEPRDFIEEDYRQIIESLKSETLELSDSFSAKYQDMSEYYTAWVHQIKTPIASMKLALENEDTPLSRRLSADLFRIEQYVGMVLAFIRLESPSGDYVFREYRLDPIIRQAVKRFASEFIDKKIALEYSPTDKSAVTDEKWLLFAVEQVLSNALKYTRSGSVKIYVREPLTLCIEDTGIGIAKEDLPRIFEKGYTGYNGRSDKKASGIGLYLCKRVCRNIGAAISVESDIGKGTAVMIDLARDELLAE